MARPLTGPTPTGGYPAQRPGGTPSGGYPAQRSGGGSAGDGENRGPLLIAIALVAAVLAIILILLATQKDDNNAQGPGSDGTTETTTETTDISATTEVTENGNGYTEEFRSAFLGSCTDAGSSETQCQCVLDYLVANVSIDEAIAWGSDSTSSPEINSAIADCQGG